MGNVKKTKKKPPITKEELAELYEKGRIVILPCAPGSTIYRLKENPNGENRLEPCCMGVSQIIENISLFGKTYFTDFASARSVMDGTKEENNA